MKGQTHSDDSRRVETSSSPDTMKRERGEEKGIDRKQDADQKLGESGLSVAEVASQSAYENDPTEVAHQAADSDRNRRS